MFSDLAKISFTFFLFRKSLSVLSYTTVNFLDSLICSSSHVHHVRKEITMIKFYLFTSLAVKNIENPT